MEFEAIMVWMVILFGLWAVVVFITLLGLATWGIIMAVLSGQRRSL